MVEKILESFKIVPQKYHNGALVGEDSHRLLQNSEEILFMILDLFRNPDIRRSNDIPDDLDARVTAVINTLMDMMLLLDHICSTMAQQRNENVNGDEEFDLFDAAVATFGEIWRRDLRISVPPKLHILETHSGPQLREWGTLGIFGEDPIEREHHTRKCLNRIFACMRDWEAIQKAIHSRKNRLNTPAVQLAIAQIASGTKRKMGPASVAKSSAKKESKAGIKMAKKDQVRLVTLSHVLFD